MEVIEGSMSTASQGQKSSRAFMGSHTDPRRQGAAQRKSEATPTFYTGHRNKIHMLLLPANLISC